MSVNVVPHLNFRGEARQALEFYQSVFGGDLVVVTYKDLGQVQAPEDADRVIWGQVIAETGFKVMAFDATAQVPFERGQNSFYVAARFSTADEAKSCWEKLKSEASLRHELGPAPWSPMYGMLQDKFGIVWVVDVLTEAHT